MVKSCTLNSVTVTVNCGYPNLLPRLENASESAPYYDIIPLEGTNITFSCPPGSVLSGPNLATCAENGQWEFYLNGLTCAITDLKGMTHNTIIHCA